MVTEYDPEGKVVWEYEIKTRVYGAIRLKSGNTLIASGSGNSVVEVTPDKKVVWEYHHPQLTGIHELHVVKTNGKAIKGSMKFVSGVTPILPSAL